MRSMTSRARRRTLGSLMLIVMGAAHVAVAGIFYTDEVPLYAVWQKSVTNTGSYSNPFDFNEVELQGEFTAPSGEKTDFFGFYDGDGNGGQEGDTWKIRFMPTETGTYQYSLSFSDGTDVSGNSGSFTVVESDLPGPPALMGETPPASWFFKDSRGNPVKWKSYSLAFTAWKTNNGGHDFYEQECADFMLAAIDDHMVKQGYNATMLESPINSATGPVGLMHEDGKSYHLGCAKNMDLIVEKLAEEKIWAVNWTAYTTQPGEALTGENTWDNLYNNRELLMRYKVARYGPFYNYFGWSPTWETWELEDETARTEEIQKLVIDYSPWEKFPTTHSATRTEWKDWQRLQLRQHESNTIEDGNVHADGRGGWSDYPYAVVGAEDLWEQCSGSHGNPKNGDEVRRGVWGELLAGVYTMYSEWRHGGEGAGPCGGNGDGEGDQYNKIAMDFWYDNTQWYTYTMKNNLVGKGICSGNDNAEYFVYNHEGGNTTIDLSGASGTYEVTWLNPLSGDTESGGAVDGGSSVSLEPLGSMSSEWAALIRNTSAVGVKTSPLKTGARRPLIGFHGNDVSVGFPNGKTPAHAAVYSLDGAVIARGQLHRACGRVQLTLPETFSGLCVVRFSGKGTEYAVRTNLIR